MTHSRIDRLEVANFQSLSKADIALGPFTVIVGPSNSGKSALLRALKAVVRNVNSPSAVRVGKTLFTAEVGFDDTVVSIERGKSQSTYRIETQGKDEEVYTKAGRTVPEDVQKVLRLPLPEGPDLVFSSQIDPPFLLAETGATAAKMLGDLTNVSKLHTAAKEANRRRLEASKIQKIREADYDGCVTEVRAKFFDLGARKRVLTEARELLETVQAKARVHDSLEAVLNDLAVCESAEADLRMRLKELPEPADIETLAENAGTLLGKRHALLDTLGSLAQITDAEAQLKSIMVKAAEDENQADKDYHDALVQAGQCPTCGQEVA